MPDFLTKLLEWMEAHPGFLWGLAVFSVVSFLAGISLVPWMVIRLPADYLVRPAPPPPAGWLASARRLAGKMLKNLLGIVLVAVGVLLFVLPGQGLLTVLLGLSFLDFPGKRRLEIWGLTRPAVFRAVNARRARWERPPLLAPE